MEPVGVLAVRSLVFEYSGDSDRLGALMGSFRLLVNETLREAAAHDARSRNRVSTVLYHSMAARHRIQRAYIVEAFGVCAGLLKAHRRRARKGRSGPLPYVRRPLLRVPAQTVQLDRDTGRLRIPVSHGEPAIVVQLAVSEWHRSHLADPAWRVAGLTVVPGRIILALKKAAPAPFPPEAVLALDTKDRKSVV